MSAPRLAAAKLIRLNRRTRSAAKTGVLLLGLGFPLAAFWVEAAVGFPLAALRSHGLFSSSVAAVATAVLIARRRALKRAEFARSWLAAVPVRAWTARAESLLIEMLPAIAAIGLLTLSGSACALALMLAKRADGIALLSVWGTLSGGIIAGMFGSFLVPQPKPVDLPPGSRYVPQQKSRRPARIRPSLSALGSWPIRQAFAWAQPKIVARAAIPILVIMPLGTTADSAMIAIALFGIVGALLLLVSGVISASRSARRWLAPLPVRSGEAIRAFLLPACSAIAASGVIEALLLAAADVGYRTAAEAGVCTATAGCLIVSAALIWNARRP